MAAAKELEERLAKSKEDEAREAQRLIEKKEKQLKIFEVGLELGLDLR